MAAGTSRFDRSPCHVDGGRQQGPVTGGNHHASGKAEHDVEHLAVD